MSLTKMICGDATLGKTDLLISNVNGLIDATGSSEKVKSVTPTDFFPINCYDSLGDFMYGQSTTGDNQVVRVNVKTKEQINYGVALPVAGIRNIKALSPTSMIVEVSAGTNFYRYYKTINSGATWSLVLTQDISNVRTLTNRSICIANISGSTVLLMGEYNINSSRVNGSTNDRIRLLRSDDMGDTWIAVTEWNTDGSNNNVRHIHAVKQNPNNGRIYVITGDSNAQSSVYSWDGLSAWPANVNPANVIQTSGLINVSGRQAFRTVDLLFKDSTIYMMPDAPTGAFGNDTECGIWTISSDLNISTLKRISTVSTHMTGIAGWLAVWLPDGRQVWLAGNEIIQTGEKYNCIILSNHDLTEWKTVGAYRGTDASTFIVPLDLFVNGSEVFASCSTGSGKSDGTTVSFVTTENDFKGDYETLYTPDTIHPVYWIDSINGSDANTGWNPRVPFKNAEYALTGGRVTYGGRLQIVGDRLDVKNAIQPSLSGNAKGGDPAEFATLQGDGATKTDAVYTADASSTTFVNFANNTPQKLEFRDLWVKTEKSTVNGVETFDAPLTGTHEFRTVRCIWGEYKDKATKFSRLLRSYRCKTYVYSCVMELHPSIVKGAFDSKATGESDYYVEDSLFLMGNSHITIVGGSNVLKAYKCTFIGAVDSSLNVATGASFNSRSFLKCGWWTAGVKTSVAVKDLASLTWSGELKMSNGNQPRGVSAAFDGYSILNQGVIPLVNYSDYVY